MFSIDHQQSPNGVIQYTAPQYHKVTSPTTFTHTLCIQYLKVGARDKCLPGTSTSTLRATCCTPGYCLMRSKPKASISRARGAWPSEAHRRESTPRGVPDLVRQKGKKTKNRGIEPSNRARTSQLDLNAVRSPTFDLADTDRRRTAHLNGT